MALPYGAEKVDQGDPQARTEISAIKVFVPAAYARVVDRAIQVWGAAGVTNDLPLAQMYLGARTLRLDRRVGGAIPTNGVAKR